MKITFTARQTNRRNTVEVPAEVRTLLTENLNNLNQNQKSIMNIGEVAQADSTRTKRYVSIVAGELNIPITQEYDETKKVLSVRFRGSRPTLDKNAIREAILANVEKHPSVTKLHYATSSKPSQLKTVLNPMVDSGQLYVEKSGVTVNYRINKDYVDPNQAPAQTEQTSQTPQASGSKKNKK